MIQRSSSRNRFRTLLAAEEDDPLRGVANLFDVAMVFVVALMIALLTRSPLQNLIGHNDEITVIKNPGTPNMEIIHRDGETLQHYRLSQQTVGGNGERLGIAYRLKSGEVVYVPEKIVAP